MKDKFIKYYPFWFGLLLTISFFGLCIEYNVVSFAVIGAYLIGFFKLSKWHQDE